MVVFSIVKTTTEFIWLFFSECFEGHSIVNIFIRVRLSLKLWFWGGIYTHSLMQSIMQRNESMAYLCTCEDLLGEACSLDPLKISPFIPSSLVINFIVHSPKFLCSLKLIPNISLVPLKWIIIFRKTPRRSLPALFSTEFSHLQIAGEGKLIFIFHLVILSVYTPKSPFLSYLYDLLNTNVHLPLQFSLVLE